MERTFVMVKPDGVQRALVGEIIRRIEQKGFKLLAMKMMFISRGLGEEHYSEHRDKSFFNDLLEFITSGPVVTMIWEGTGVISGIRSLMGKTNPAEASPGTIRGDLATIMSFNIIHGSDSPEAAQREINLFFEPQEVCEYQRAIDTWIN
jgi:nucleoside-diphosphate kinase